MRLDRVPDPPKLTIQWEASFVADGAPAGGATEMFVSHAQAAGNAVLVQVACIAPLEPTGVSIDATNG